MKLIYDGSNVIFPNNGIFKVGLCMQIFLKILFWVSVGLSILIAGIGWLAGIVWMTGYYIPLYLAVALWFLPIFFVKNRTYRIASLLICLGWLAFASMDYSAWERHKESKRQSEQLAKDIDI